MLTFLDKKYTPASKKNMHAERTNILVKHLGQEAFMFTDALLLDTRQQKKDQDREPVYSKILRIIILD
jgi:hypothetical protein